LRKIIILALSIIFAVILIADEHSNEELFKVYQQDKSFENFQKAAEQYVPISKEPNSALMLSYLHLMEFYRNLDVLKTDLDSLDTRTKFAYANLLLDIGKTEESIKVYEDLNASFPKWSCPWRHKGEALLKQKDYQEAEKATEKAIEVREDHFDAYIQLAIIQKNLGKYEIALNTLNKGLQFEEADHEEEVTSKEVESLRSELKELIKRK